MKAGQYCADQSACMHGPRPDSLIVLCQLWYEPSMSIHDGHVCVQL